MTIDYGALAFPKGAPRVVTRAVKRKVEDANRLAVNAQVDRRDGRRCRVTGVRLEPFAVDPARRLERHHLEYRSRNLARRYTYVNVLTLAAVVHQAIHAGAFVLLDKHGQPCRDERDLVACQWVRSVVARGAEPFIVRGLPVVHP